VQQEPPISGQRVIVVAAHPDDETIGAGGALPLASEVIFVHLTDGASRDLQEAQAKGFASWVEYAAARRQEFQNALQAGGIVPVACVDLGYPDQEASLHMPEIVHGLMRLLTRSRFDLILVHPYEGGHPDHDAAAFAAQSAVKLLTERSSPRRVEFTSYHSRHGRLEAGMFLPNGSREMVYRLGPEERARKVRMLACYQSQQEVLRQSPVEEERFRTAPDYDFARPPHEGRLYYELFPWGMTGAHWLALAEAAEKQLGLCGPPPAWLQTPRPRL